MKNNSAAFGMTIQKIICDMYNLEPNEEASKQFHSNYSSEFEDVKLILPKVFKEIGAYPVSCVTCEKNIVEEKVFKSPHNFYLSNGLTLSVKTTRKKNGRVAPQIVGQAGYETLNYHFGHLLTTKIDNKFDIKYLMWNKIDQVLPIFVDYLFMSDILLWIYMDNGKYSYKVIFRNEKVDIKWDRKKIQFSLPSIGVWKESVTVKYDNISIAEIQVHKKRSFKFRFALDNLVSVLLKKERNNETLGISIENLICNLFNLDKPYHLDERSDDFIMSSAEKTVIEAFKNMPLPIYYVGSEKGVRGGASKSSVDFVLDGNKTLSLKTNIGNKVCPPEIGQPSLDTFKLYFPYLISDPSSFNSDEFKKIAMTDTAVLLNEYLNHLLDCDYLLWVYKRNDNYEYKILDKNVSFKFDQNRITFTRDILSWNESNTVKYDGITIGEFQVHNNRNSLKFRFDMNNLIKIIENNN